MLQIKVSSPQVGAKLNQLVREIGHPATVLESIGHMLEENARGRFATASDPDGAPWQPWANSTRQGYPFPGTIAAAGQDGPGNGRLLDRYGKMWGDLNHQLDADGNGVRVGFAADYAVFHEFGTKDMPRRGLLLSDPEAGTLGAEDESALLGLMDSWLSGLMD